MIQINKGDIKMKGTIGDLMDEVVYAFHSVAKAGNNEIPDISYDDIVERMMTAFKLLREVDQDGKLFGSQKEEKAEIEFLKEANELKRKNKGNPNFFYIDEIRRDQYSQQAHTAKKNQSQKFSVKGFIKDPRARKDDFE